MSAHPLEGLMKWAKRDRWRDSFAEFMPLHLDRACANNGVATEALPDMIGDAGGPLWGCVFEDFLTAEIAEDGNIVADYLKRRGWKESASNKAYMSALRSSVMSLYEVSDIVRDESFLARDLVRGGEPVRVSERMATRSLKPWDRIAARIMQVGGETVMSGGVLPFDPAASDFVLGELRRLRKRSLARAKSARRRGKAGTAAAEPASDTELLRTMAPLFTEVWLEDTLQRMLDPRLPPFCNTDGDPFAPTVVRYPLAGATAEAVGRALAGISALVPADATSWDWLEPRKSGRKPPASGIVVMSKRDDGSTVLGTLRLTGAALVLETNSRERAGRGRALIEPALGRLVGAPTIETEDRPATSPAGRKKRPASRLTPDEERAIIRSVLDQHYAEVLDEPLPMLGNITPRQAARSARGRDKLVAWLKQVENRTARLAGDEAGEGHDFGWMWDSLGVGHLRR